MAGRRIEPGRWSSCLTPGGLRRWLGCDFLDDADVLRLPAGQVAPSAAAAVKAPDFHHLRTFLRRIIRWMRTSASSIQGEPGAAVPAGWAAGEAGPGEGLDGTKVKAIAPRHPGVRYQRTGQGEGAASPWLRRPAEVAAPRQRMMAIAGGTAPASVEMSLGCGGVGRANTGSVGADTGSHGGAGEPWRRRAAMQAEADRSSSPGCGPTAASTTQAQVVTSAARWMSESRITIRRTRPSQGVD